MRLMKRPRVTSSTSFVDVQGKKSGLKTTELRCNRRTAQKTSHNEGQSCRAEEGILRAASPETVTERYDHVKGPLGCFLESCYFCKKKLLKGKDVYMYGVLHGFCSPECRAYQMEIDKAAEKVAEKLKGVAIQCSSAKER